MLSLEQIKELIDHVVDRGVASVEIERSGFRLRIEGPRAAAALPPSSSPMTEGVAEPIPTAAKTLPSPRDPAEPKPEPETTSASPLTDGEHLLSSPIVGTFYAAPSPGSAPFVSDGDVVHKGQVICIVEAMKLMNEIECDVDGVVVRALVENGEPVEFGQPLFAISADG